jgi:hypothetical protein
MIHRPTLYSKYLQCMNVYECYSLLFIYMLKPNKNLIEEEEEEY